MCAKGHIEYEWPETTFLPSNNCPLHFFGEAYENDPLLQLQECRQTTINSNRKIPLKSIKKKSAVTKGYKDAVLKPSLPYTITNSIL